MFFEAIEPEPETQPLPPLQLYTLTWSDNSSAGNIVVIARSEEEAVKYATQNTMKEVEVEGCQPVLPGAYVVTTTDRNPL